MCIMTVMYQVLPDMPVVLAANRDEYYSRQAIEPHRLHTSPSVWGGRDEQAGGTWLGVNEYGVVVGLTNRRMQEDQETIADRRSRGLLCIDALKHRCAADVADLLVREPDDHYNPFNLLALDAKSALWITYDAKAEVQPLQPGIHILANRDLNDMSHARVQRANQLVASAKGALVDDILQQCARCCADHEPQVEDRETICMHRDNKTYGTVSSTILAISVNRTESRYLYAHGHPCEVPYHDFSSLLTQDSRDWSVVSPNLC